MTEPLSTLVVLGTGFVLGLRHALDADHVAAVSAMVRSSDNTLVTARIGAFWGAGHTATLMLVCLVIVPLDIPISAGVEAFLELIVGVMLLGLGWRVLAQAQTEHTDRLGGASGFKSFLVGAVHGLAGSAAVSVLILTTVDSLAVGLMYVAVFGVGATFGMLAFSGLLSIPMRMMGRNAEFLAGAASIVAGILVILDSVLT